jgi:anti-sigma B factor antagonist
MNLTASTRRVADVTILDLRGNIVLGKESAAFRDLVCNLLAGGSRKILVNLAGIHYIDSTGLAHLVGAVVSVRKLHGEMKLLNLTKQSHALLQIAKLHTVLDSFDNETLAVDSFVHSVAAMG